MVLMILMWSRKLAIETAREVCTNALVTLAIGICLIGIQPESVDLGMEMTGPVGSRMEELIDLTIKQLREWTITCALRSP